MNYSEFFRSYFSDTNDANEKKLVIILGVFGDFDAFEYAHNLYKKLEIIKASGIQINLLGIGNESSRLRFSNFVKIPIEHISLTPDNSIHKKLKLETDLNPNLHPLLNLLLMCSGYNSPGTLKEVLRGYIGDEKSNQIFTYEDEIRIGNLFNMKGSIFDFFKSTKHLRPFELATLRLINMIEILTYWNDYVVDVSFICQRGATYLFDEEGKLIYSFKAKSLLGYSNNMTDPLDYLSSHLVDL